MLNMGSALIEHSFIAARVADMETWHRHLGHISYMSVVDMSNKDMVKGMHINLSSTPPNVNLVFLGNRLRHQPPRYKKGCRLKEF